MKILVVSPGEYPKVQEIEGTLESMQTVVGGLIEAIYPFDEPVALICNEEGKLEGLTWNRILMDAEGNLLDIICGTFFLCAAPPDEEDFVGLTDGQIERYGKLCRGMVIAL